MKKIIFIFALSLIMSCSIFSAFAVELDPEYTREQAEAITTREIVDEISTSGWIIDYMLYNVDNYEYVMELFCEKHPIFDVAMDREDLTEAIFASYQDAHIVTQKEHDDALAAGEDVYYQTLKLGMQTDNLEFLMIADQFKHGEYTAAEKVQVSVLVSKKVFEQSQYPALYDIGYPRYQRFVDATGLFPCFFRLETYEAVGQPAIVYTPRDGHVYAEYNRVPELSSLAIAIAKAQDAASYPEAIYLSPATVKYNCHSYAWYWPAVGNLYWINDPSPYWEDGSYIRTYDPEIGDIVYFAGADDHSGIIMVWMLLYSKILIDFFVLL